MIDKQGLDRGLGEIRGLLQADGGDMAIVDVDDQAGSVMMRLVLESAKCRECVLPRQLLEQVGLDILGRAGAGVTRLSIEDPRES